MRYFNEQTLPYAPCKGRSEKPVPLIVFNSHILPSEQFLRVEKNKAPLSGNLSLT